jgi:hypothetical protein
MPKVPGVILQLESPMMRPIESDRLYEARDERGLVVFVRPVKYGTAGVRCQDVNSPERTLVLPPDRIVREVTARPQRP